MQAVFTNIILKGGLYAIINTVKALYMKLYQMFLSKFILTSVPKIAMVGLASAYFLKKAFIDKGVNP